jgi:hypothetical protein
MNPTVLPGDLDPILKVGRQTGIFFGQGFQDLSRLVSLDIDLVLDHLIARQIIGDLTNALTRFSQEG